MLESHVRTMWSLVSSVLPKNLFVDFQSYEVYTYLSCLARPHLDRFMEDVSVEHRLGDARET